MFEKSFLEPPPLRTTVTVLLTLWCFILVPWLPFFTLMGTGMAFEAGYTWGAYLLVFGVWAYPVLVAVAYFYRRRKPALAWLPSLILIPVLFELFSN